MTVDVHAEGKEDVTYEVHCMHFKTCPSCAKAKRMRLELKKTWHIIAFSSGFFIAWLWDVFH